MDGASDKAPARFIQYPEEESQPSSKRRRSTLPSAEFQPAAADSDPEPQITVGQAWSSLSSVSERRRNQNRLAQRVYRQKQKQLGKKEGKGSDGGSSQVSKAKSFGGGDTAENGRLGQAECRKRLRKDETTAQQLWTSCTNPHSDPPLSQTPTMTQYEGFQHHYHNSQDDFPGFSQNTQGNTHEAAQHYLADMRTDSLVRHSDLSNYPELDHDIDKYLLITGGEGENHEQPDVSTNIQSVDCLSRPDTRIHDRDQYTKPTIHQQKKKHDIPPIPSFQEVPSVEAEMSMVVAPVAGYRTVLARRYTTADPWSCKDYSLEWPPRRSSQVQTQVPSKHSNDPLLPSDTSPKPQLHFPEGAGAIPLPTSSPSPLDDEFCFAIDGGTPLHNAIAFQQNTVAAILISSGASPTAVTIALHTPLHLAASLGNTALISLLQPHYDRKSLNLQDKNGYTPLAAACIHGHLAAVRLLIDGGADLKEKDHRGREVLALAAMDGHVDVVQLLVERKVDVSAADLRGWTALHWAVRWGWDKVVEVLVNAGADVNAVTAV